MMTSVMMLISCTKENDIMEFSDTEQNTEALLSMASEYTVGTSISLETICGIVTEKSLVSNGDFVGGTLSIANDAEQLMFLYEATEGWLISEVQLYFGDLDEIPAVSNGNPIMGHFPYKTSVNPPLAAVPVSFILDELTFDETNKLTIVAHATVISGEGDELVSKSVYAAWDEGLTFSGNKWGGGFVYEKQLCDGEVLPIEILENAAAEMSEAEVTGLMCFAPAQLFLTFDNEEYIGTINFALDDALENMVVTYTLFDESDWNISVVHINIGDLELSQISKGNSGNPVVGQFDYVYHLDASVDNILSYAYNIPLVDLNPEFLAGGCEDFIVQATLVSEVEVDGVISEVTKSAFAQWEQSFASPKKGGYFELCLLNCVEE